MNIPIVLALLCQEQGCGVVLQSLEVGLAGKMPLALEETAESKTYLYIFFPHEFDMDHLSAQQSPPSQHSKQNIAPDTDNNYYACLLIGAYHQKLLDKTMNLWWRS